MNNSSSSIDFALLNQTINRYVPIPLLFFGIMGNILNILIFTRKIFRQNTCVTYLLASSVCDFVAIIAGLFPRVLAGFGYDRSQGSSIFCKLRFFFSYFSGYTAAWFISLACVERYLSSSTNVHRRRLITMKNAYLSILIVIILGFVIFGEQFYCIDINQQLFGAPQSCFQLQQSIQCQIVDSVLQFFFEMLMPAAMMFVFGLLTLGNIRHQRRRITAIQTISIAERTVDATVGRRSSAQTQAINIANDPNKRTNLTKSDRIQQKRDAQLITMLLVQITIFIISTFPISVYKIYSVATTYTTKSILRKSIENTIFSISVISLFLNNTITFYIYTLSGAVFRKELLKLFRLT